MLVLGEIKYIISKKSPSPNRKKTFQIKIEILNKLQKYNII